MRPQSPQSGPPDQPNQTAAAEQNPQDESPTPTKTRSTRRAKSGSRISRWAKGIAIALTGGTVTAAGAGVGAAVLINRASDEATNKGQSQTRQDPRWGATMLPTAAEQPTAPTTGASASKYPDPLQLTFPQRLTKDAAGQPFTDMDGNPITYTIAATVSDTPGPDGWATNISFHDAAGNPLTDFTNTSAELTDARGNPISPGASSDSAHVWIPTNTPPGKYELQVTTTDFDYQQRTLEIPVHVSPAKELINEPLPGGGTLTVKAIRNGFAGKLLGTATITNKSTKIESIDIAPFDGRIAVTEEANNRTSFATDTGVPNNAQLSVRTNGEVYKANVPANQYRITGREQSLSPSHTPGLG